MGNDAPRNDEKGGMLPNSPGIRVDRNNFQA
jgi:hypothetical protein